MKKTVSMQSRYWFNDDQQIELMPFVFSSDQLHLLRSRKDKQTHIPTPATESVKADWHVLSGGSFLVSKDYYDVHKTDKRIHRLLLLDNHPQQNDSSYYE